MKFVDLITNAGYDPINSKILDYLNYKELKNCCKTSKAIENYIKTHCEKWKLLEKLQERKYVIKSRGESMPTEDFVEFYWNLEPIIKLFGSKTFKYFEKNGNKEQLTLFLEFIQAYLDDEKTHHWTSPIQFAVQEKRIDFVNLMIPVPLPLEDLELKNSIGGIWLMPKAIRNDDIEMVKLLLKYSEEKDVNLHVYRFNVETGRDENIILGLAARLGHHKIAQLIQDVFEGKIDKKDLQPVVRRF